eukprot:GHVP01040680.1.p1 GENE.GHVP01040680.1~~GHVP01040680.1.p1  ORF type:complete len:302 (+),score=56.29 GHVP01040680.1:47-907(+)
MADRGGYSGGFGRAGRDSRARGGARAQRRGRGRKSPEDELKSWDPLTKLGRLVKRGQITTLEEIFYHSMTIKEHQVVDWIYQMMKSSAAADGDEFDDAKKRELEDEVMKIMSVQKQTKAGQRTRFKAFVTVGDRHGFVGLGVKVAKEVATAIRGAIISAKISIIPVRRGYWGSRLGDPHTVPMKVSGKCGSVRVRLIPAPRGTLVVGAPTTKKMLQFAGVKDCFTASTGSTKTRGNFLKAVFYALRSTYSYVTPDLWLNRAIKVSPFEEHSEFLATNETITGDITV